jgi:hypothetical protein
VTVLISRFAAKEKMRDNFTVEYSYLEEAHAFSLLPQKTKKA